MKQKVTYLCLCCLKCDETPKGISSTDLDEFINIDAILILRKQKHTILNSDDLDGEEKINAHSNVAIH